MATYLCVKANNQNKSFTAKESKEAGKPYLCVKASNSVGYFPLTTETSTGTKIKVKANNGNTYRIVETYTTTQQITVTTGTSYETRSSTSATTYYTRKSTSATNYQTRASTSATNYLTRASTSATDYGTNTSLGGSVNFNVSQSHSVIMNITETKIITSFKGTRTTNSIKNFRLTLSREQSRLDSYLFSITSINSNVVTSTFTNNMYTTQYFTLSQITNGTTYSSSLEYYWKVNNTHNIVIPLDFYFQNVTNTTTVHNLASNQNYKLSVQGKQTTKSINAYATSTVINFYNHQVSLINTVTTGTTYYTRSSTSATQYATRSSTSATEYATRSSTSVTSYLTRSSTSKTVYLTTTSSEQITTQ